MGLFGDTYRNRKVLVTGHTGFKGSWLSLWLRELGADLHGLSLAPETDPNHWSLLGLDVPEEYTDIRDFGSVTAILRSSRPEIVFHLAAQPLVRRSYRDPVETWSTNVLGTANLLQACRQTESVRAVVVVTTDKVYRNEERQRGYREEDRLGGHDPYSASKASAELVVASFRNSFAGGGSGPLLATARAGNVIGGGDWSEDRLIPDLVRSLQGGRVMEIRSPGATRPWQHVLESLSGYLLLGQHLLAGERAFADAWNFGPEPASNQSVADILGRLLSHWPALRWSTTAAPQPHEANLLYLDSSKAMSLLKWSSVWSLDDTLAATALWYQGYRRDPRALSSAQLASFVAAAKQKRLCWVTP